MTTEITLTLLRHDLAELPQLTLHAVTPNQPVKTFPLGLEAVVVGSGDNAHVMVADEHVSRNHCELRLCPNGVLVRDLRSKNGTFVRGVRIEGAYLAPGEMVQIGDTQISVQVVGPPTQIELSRAASFGDALGGTVVMRALFAKLERAAKSDETVLLTGESGTGKELLAHAIHERSPRRGGPFVVFDCSALSDAIFESELFGYVKGAFTGADAPRAGMLEAANGGTVFIDEIGELPLHLQPALLRAVESRHVRRLGSNEWVPFDARIVAATHRDLRQLVAEGSFRHDLYYRLCVVEAQVPSLRERKDDIALLVERFLAILNPPRSLDDLPANALDLLKGHDWPGNVRELRNTVARLVLFPELLDDAIAASPVRAASKSSELLAMPWKAARELALDEFERRYLAAMMDKHQGHIATIAEEMRVSKQLVYRLL
ncbi:MAG TPA: sigma 54-interacting transcriptional regulator, partial [Polyangiaceae bacterium]|nr:sigma 54-interacting transcriptional regulator [Polyangiaceae bacterium]